MFLLRVTQGPREGDEFEIEQELTLGREGVDVVIDDEELSRRHATVRVSGDALVIEDLGSLNGTLVNNLPISSETRLAAGDLIEVGSTVLEVQTRDDDPGKTVLKARPPDPNVGQDTAPVPTERPEDSDPTMVVRRDATEIDRNVAPALMAEPPPMPPLPTVPPPSAPAPAVPAPAPAPAAAPVQFLFSGQRYLLGATSGMYGIWDRSTPGTPVESFPKDDEGWQRAWDVFSAREPGAERVVGTAMADAPRSDTATPTAGAGAAPSGSATRTGKTTAAGWLLLVGGAINVLLGFSFLASSDPSIEKAVLQIIGMGCLILGAAGIAAGALVLQRKREGRTLAYVVAGGLFLLALFVLIQGGRVGPLWIGSATLIVIFLRQSTDFDRRGI